MYLILEPAHLFGVDAALGVEDSNSSCVVSLSMVSYTKSIPCVSGACNSQREKRSTVNVLAKNKVAIGVGGCGGRN